MLTTTERKHKLLWVISQWSQESLTIKIKFNMRVDANLSSFSQEEWKVKLRTMTNQHFRWILTHRKPTRARGCGLRSNSKTMNRAKKMELASWILKASQQHKVRWSFEQNNNHNSILLQSFKLRPLVLFTILNRKKLMKWRDTLQMGFRCRGG